jgi:hypothetical protein
MQEALNMTPNQAPLDDVIQTAEGYRENVHMISRGQHKAGDIAHSYSTWLGLPVVVLTTIVGTSIFATINDQPELIYRVVAGAFSLLAAVLAAVQIFFKFSEREQRARTAAVGYSALQRELDIFLLKCSDQKFSREAAIDELNAINNKISKLAEESPAISDTAWKKARDETAQESREARRRFTTQAV